MTKSSALSLNLAQPPKRKENGSKHSMGPSSPQSPPPSSGSLELRSEGHSFYVEPTPHASEFPAPPGSPSSPRHKKDTSRSVFSNYKASKSSSRVNPSEVSIREVSDSRPERSQIYPHRQSPGSSPELGKSMENASIASVSSSQTETTDQRGQATKSNSLPHIDTDLPASNKRGNPKNRFPNILSRTRSTSTKGFEEPLKPKPKPSTPVTRFPPEQDLHKHLGRHLTDSHAAKSAPLEKDRGFREMMTSMNSSIRNRSADRHTAIESEDDASLAPKEKKESFSFSSSFKGDGAGTSLLHNIKNQGSKAAGGINKAGKGIFGKLTRSGSSNEREAKQESEWTPHVIRLPLVEQTRRTRISKRLEDSRDKTEFWMPALPWRCIDFLNANGCEEEGLYRVPGSGKDIKHWEKRFDLEGDIDLFDEKELYDINIIGSMFKAWLRELPDEILPKSTQAKIAEQCAGAKTTPQLLKDELSRLPPYNYYLLFAITCHISLLHSCSEKNRMDYRNLCICFQPCMKIEAFCFQFLVLDWRNCWQGCWTEDEYKTKERDLGTNRNRSVSQDRPERKDEAKASKPPSPLPNGRQTGSSNHSTLASSKSQIPYPMNGDRSISSGSSRPSITESSTPEHRQPRNPDFEDDATPTQAGHLKKDSELPSLSPMKPLSPPWTNGGRVP